MKMAEESIPETAVYAKIPWWMIKRKLLYYSQSNENKREYSSTTEGSPHEGP